MKRFMAVLYARTLEFFRDRAALSWNFIMPVAFVFGLAFLFSNPDKDMFKVGVYPQSASASARDLPFFQIRHIKFIAQNDLAGAIEKVKHHQLDMLVDVNSPSRYWVNSTNTNGYFLEKLLLSESARPAGGMPAKQSVSGREVRYVDWVLPGVLSVNMMFSCLYGVGYVIVRYRKNRVLRRLQATPLRVFEFLAAQVVSRWMVTLVVGVMVFISCDIFIHFFMQGSYWLLFLVFASGSLTLISLGLVIAARIKSEELSDGILNLISWPMMLVSGAWFSLEGVNPLAQQLAQIFPLTHMIAAARAIMNDGAGIVDIYPHLLTLSAMTVVFLTVGSLTFRWE